MPDDYREVVTTALDVVAVLGVGFGVAAGLLPVIGWASVAVGGAVVLGAVRAYNWAASRPGRES